jgi:hypothetical protein
MLLYRHHGDVVYNDCIHAELSEGRDRPSAELIREHMRQLRKVLAGSRSSIIGASALSSWRAAGGDGLASGHGAVGAACEHSPARQTRFRCLLLQVPRRRAA